MNLSITPTNFQNNYLKTQNYRKSSNNQNQNFAALKINLKNPSGYPIKQKTDIILDKFIGYFEKTAKSIGINTDSLTKKGYSLDIFTDAHDTSSLTGILKNKHDEPVVRNGSILHCRIAEFSEKNTAESFANSLKQINREG